MAEPGVARRSVLLGGAGLLAGCAAQPPMGLPALSAADEMVADLKQRTFRFFWDTTNPANGLAVDRWPTKSFASIASVGFALTAYGVGVENGWITRAQARDRTLTTLRFFANAPQGPQTSGVSGHRGFFYHFLDMQTGMRFERVELSTIDTTLMLGGALFAQGYFDRDEPGEAEIRSLAEKLYRDVQWTWIMPRKPFVGMGWHPENGGKFIDSHWDQYNEAMLLYVLGLGSPTHPLPDGTWDAWSANFERQWGVHWGQEHLHFAPLFGHQYSHVWVDFRGIRDRFTRAKGIDYFENSRRAVYAQRAYAQSRADRFRDYGEVFGLTACDGPGDFKQSIDGREYEFFSYSARGPGERDDGTLAPTALGGSVAFAPELAIPGLAEMRRRYGDHLYQRYGFLDSFNPTLRSVPGKLQHGKITPVGWVDGDYLGIDQGPICLMIANHESDFVWKIMRKSPHIRRGLQRAGFTGGWLDQG